MIGAFALVLLVWAFGMALICVAFGCTFACMSMLVGYLESLGARLAPSDERGGA